ncbi:sirohydrochlorin chelatase [Caldanaerobacter sp.]|uniref:sirohydrochlorin chelatase n=1 Tax=Caldanaerobacter sp. TaxID=2930036 RepID=UPI003C72CAB1
MERGLLIIAHGSRVDETKEVVEKVAMRIREFGQYKKVEAAFMEFNEPDIPAAIEDFVKEGIFEIIAVPMFLFEGIHIREDIPELFEKEKEKYPNLNIKFARPMGYDDRIVEIILERAREVL